MNPYLYGMVLLLGDGEQFYGISQFLCIAKVTGGKTGNALTIDVLRTNLGAEGDGSEYGKFVGGIYSINIVGRIGFGVA